MKKIFALAALAALGGCASPVNIAKIEPPAAVLLVPPKPLPDVQEGDDIVEQYAGLRRTYIEESSKLRRLQRYVAIMRRREAADAQ